MLSIKKKVLTIRISGRERKNKVRKLLFDLAHFRNLLLILINNYYQTYKENLLNQSIIYGLLSKRGYKGKYKEEYESILKNISTDITLKDILNKLKDQKEKISNVPLVQYIIRQVIKDYNNYYKALKEYYKNPKKFKGIPRPPKPKKIKYIMNFTVEGNINTFGQEKDYLLIRLREGKYLKVKLPKNFPYRISSVRLKFFGNDLYVDVVYEYKVKGITPKGEYKAGIDVGLDELLSVVSENPNLRSFIVSGREIKAFNQWYNKEKAKLQSQIDYLKNELRNDDNYEEKDVKYLQRKLQELEVKSKILSSYRKRWIDTQFHRISRKIVDILYETGHKIIYIGKNALESKNGIDLGKKVNQAFVFIPFRRLIELIKYKAEDLGMKVVEVDESFTSRTSPFVDLEEAKRTKDFKGERNGNLFKDKVINKIFHADLVGALNILRRGAKLPRLNFYDNLKILFIKLCNPVRIKLMDLFFKVIPKSLLIGEIGDSKLETVSPAGLSPRA